MFLAWFPQPVFPCHDDGRAGDVGQFCEFRLCVSVPVSPVFESFLAGRPCFDESVVDWCMFPVGCDAVEEACVCVLVDLEFFVSDGDGEEFLFHGFSYFLSSGVVVSRISSMSSSPFLVSCHRQHGLFRSLMPFLSMRWTYPSRSSSTRRLLRLWGVSRYRKSSAICVNCSWVIGFLTAWRITIAWICGVLCIRVYFLLDAGSRRRCLLLWPVR